MNHAVALLIYFANRIILELHNFQKFSFCTLLLINIILFSFKLPPLVIIIIKICPSKTKIHNLTIPKISRHAIKV